MGKQIIRVSRWSLRSVISAYGKVMTFIFAFFCMATGQHLKASSIRQNDQAGTLFKGIALRASDSSALGSTMIYLNDVFMPLYGVNLGPSYNPIDSVTTAPDGYFEIMTDELYQQNAAFTIIDEGSSENPIIYAVEMPEIDGDADTTYTLYFDIPTAAINETSVKINQTFLRTVQGKTMIIKIPDWKGEEKTASIVNGRGRVICTLTSAAGTFRWDTRSASKGVYFLRMDLGDRKTALKMMVQ